MSAIFHAARRRSGTDLERFLTSACADDPALRHEVETLLAHDTTSPGGLDLLAIDHVAFDAQAQTSDREMTLAPGDRIGSYDIVGTLGAGGMGEVYRARDTRLKRDMALKILGRAWSHDRDRLARFQREAEILATLNHPNIAAIYGLEHTGNVDISRDDKRFLFLKRGGSRSPDSEPHGIVVVHNWQEELKRRVPVR